MSDCEDYENNLAFPPVGDWADTNPRANTDRTASTIELINEIEKLNKWLDLKSEYISKIEEKNEKLTKQLDMAIKCLKNYKSGTTDKWFAEVALEQIEELDK